MNLPQIYEKLELQKNRIALTLQNAPKRDDLLSGNSLFGRFRFALSIDLDAYDLLKLADTINSLRADILEFNALRKNAGDCEWEQSINRTIAP